jgi:hypothetical protein
MRHEDELFGVTGNKCNETSEENRVVFQITRYFNHENYGSYLIAHFHFKISICFNRLSEVMYENLQPNSVNSTVYRFPYLVSCQT